MSEFIYFTDEHGEHGWRSDKFVERAYFEALQYGDKTKLLLAIEQGLPQLLQPEYREAFSLLMDKGGVKRPGFKPAQNLEKAKLDAEIWNRVNYWIGWGYAAYDDATGSETACQLAASELNKSATTIRDRYAKIKSNHLHKNGSLKLVAKFWQQKGAADKLHRVK